jgi:hypothetical protein
VLVIVAVVADIDVVVMMLVVIGIVVKSEVGYSFDEPKDVIVPSELLGNNVVVIHLVVICNCRFSNSLLFK